LNSFIDSSLAFKSLMILLLVSITFVSLSIFVDGLLLISLLLLILLEEKKKV